MKQTFDYNDALDADDEWDDGSEKADFSLFEKKDYIEALKFFYQHNGGWFYSAADGSNKREELVDSLHIVQEALWDVILDIVY